jgi:amidase
MTADEILLHSSALDLAALLRRREISPVELLELHLARIARCNPALNAIVSLDARTARRRAAQADRVLARGRFVPPLCGVPITVKDAFETAGCRTTCGTSGLREYVPARDAAVVSRMRAAGALVLGKTNVPELTNDYQTDNPVFGRTNNPWCVDRSPGGSTGGGAAAVAAGLSPLEVGSDLGGSLRLPAHYCGVCALKPTYGLVPMTGHIPPWPGRPRGLCHLGTAGFLARSPRDLALALRVAAGPDGADCDAVPVPLGRLTRGDSRRQPRIAWTDTVDGLPCDPEIRRGIEALARDLLDAGWIAERAAPAGLDIAGVCTVYGTIMGAEIASTMRENGSTGRAAQPPAATEDPFAEGYLRGRSSSSRVYLTALRQRAALVRAVERFLADWDAWICPAASTAAPRHAPGHPRIAVDGHMLPYTAQGWWCLGPSLTHHPAVVLPLGLTARGLPFGVQIVGRLWRDADLLSIAERIGRHIAPLPRHPDVPPVADDVSEPVTAGGATCTTWSAM